MHIDGAFGLWAAVLRRQCQLVAGLEKADIYSLGAYKRLTPPMIAVPYRANTARLINLTG